MRPDCTVYIWVAVKRAIQAGLRFFEVGNGTILCEGNAEGRIPPQFLDCTVQLHDSLSACRSRWSSVLESMRGDNSRG